MEIERKFMVIPKELPKLDSLKRSMIFQGYLSYSPEIRIRKMIISNKNYCTLTIKSEGDLVRDEYEITISTSQFHQLQHCVLNRMIHKTRYTLPYLFDNKQFKILIDIYINELQGLITAEIEFETEEDAIKFDPLGWFSIELTMDKRFKNKNLSFCKLPISDMFP